ncbi:MAG: hypothetical protein ACRDPY_32530 [Streptosporangiaceae bacterium]
MLAAGLAGDAEFRARFLRESRTAAAVDDPHIIPVYDAGQDGGVLFLAMRFVSGGDVRGCSRGSYDLLAPSVAQVFRRMSVFAGGCDLDALDAVVDGGDAAGSDPLELVAELQDVSLITVAEGIDGEPRMGMLETIRDYAAWPSGANSATGTCRRGN